LNLGFWLIIGLLFAFIRNPEISNV